MSSINMFRSAVSSTAPPWESLPLGQNELVIRCIAKMDRIRPSNPFYDSTWDLDILIRWIETLEENMKLSMKLLRIKCIILFKLVDLARSADVLAVSHKSIIFSAQEMKGLRRPLKNYIRDRPSDFRFHRLLNPKLCVVAAWEEYLNRTVNVNRIKDRVFISNDKKGKEIGSETIAKDTMKAMELAGINTNRFKSHSTRISVASKVIEKGASVDDVMRAGRWRSKEVFEKFYNRSHQLEVANLILRH
jgi:hypothetical protein